MTIHGEQPKVHEIKPDDSVFIGELLDPSSREYQSVQQLAERIYNEAVFGRFYGAIDIIPIEAGVDYRGEPIKNTNNSFGIRPLFAFSEGVRWKSTDAMPAGTGLGSPKTIGRIVEQTRYVQVKDYELPTTHVEPSSVATRGLLRRRSANPPLATPSYTEQIRIPGHEPVDLVQASKNRGGLKLIQLLAARQGRAGSMFEFDLVLDKQLCDDIVTKLVEKSQTFDMLFNALLPGVFYDRQHSEGLPLLHSAGNLHIRGLWNAWDSDRTVEIPIEPKIVYPKSTITF